MAITVAEMYVQGQRRRRNTVWSAPIRKICFCRSLFYALFFYAASFCPLTKRFQAIEILIKISLYVKRMLSSLSIQHSPAVCRRLIRIDPNVFELFT